MRTSIIPFISGQNVFDPDLAKALGDAYDAACDELEPSVQTDLVRNNSQRIIQAAKKGERDPDRLLRRLSMHSVLAGGIADMGEILKFIRDDGELCRQ